ncbi:methionine adenosyltransferase domain-containing protein [Candidatus Woesearchaeota archaeon]|nr:methionine adenosyltransferase domain-containing protein [Candidatus Woesearchaeota archaeon]
MGQFTELEQHGYEAGRRGKPDRLDADIAQLIGAELLEQDQNARFDLRVCGSWSQELGRPLVSVSGEVSAHLIGNTLYDKIRATVSGYYNQVHKSNLGEDDFIFRLGLKPQSQVLATNGHAGDYGNPIAVAYGNFPVRLPIERYIAVGIRDLIDEIYQDNGCVPWNIADVCGVPHLRANFCEGLKADGKIGVTALYEGTSLVRLESIAVAAAHEPWLPVEKLRIRLGRIISAYLSITSPNFYQLGHGNPVIQINGLGDWNGGGWVDDEGTRDAKPYSDGFSTYGCNEDSCSGEDPSKPSGTGTFLARYIASGLVGEDLAKFARVSLVYFIGSEEPLLNVITKGTGVYSQEDLQAIVKARLPLSLSNAAEGFGLRDPRLHRAVVSASDFFQNERFPWNNSSGSLGWPPITFFGK